MTTQATAEPRFADSTIHQLPERWPDPEPLRQREALPDFPLETLPPWLAEHCRHIARVTQTPVDMSAMLALPAITTATQGRFDVETLAGWTQTVNLYVAVAMPPGERKSPVHARIFSPLIAWTKQTNERLAPTIRDQMRRLRQLEAVAKRTEKAASDALEAANAAAATDEERRAATTDAAYLTADAAARDAAIALELWRSTMTRPVQLIWKDLTPEAAPAEMVLNRDHMAIVNPEGGVLETIGGRYTSTVPQLDIVNQAYNGETYIRTRVKADQNVTVDRPIMNFALAVQPAVIADLCDPRWKNRGTIARFQMVFPKTKLGQRQIRGLDPIPESSQIDYENALARIATVSHALTDVTTIALTSDAQDALYEFEEWLEPHLTPETGALDDYAEFASKTNGLTIRLAATLAIARETGVPQHVTEDDIRNAWKIVLYLIEHNKYASDLVGGHNADTLAEKIVKWASRLNEDTFTTSRVQKDLNTRRLGHEPEEVNDTLAALVKSNHLRLASIDKGVTYAINPKIRKETS